MLQVDYYRPRKQRSWPAIVMGVELMLVIGIAIVVLTRIGLDPDLLTVPAYSPSLQIIGHIAIFMVIFGLVALWLVILVWWLKGTFVKSNEIVD